MDECSDELTDNVFYLMLQVRSIMRISSLDEDFVFKQRIKLQLL